MLMRDMLVKYLNSRTLNKQRPMQYFKPLVAHTHKLNFFFFTIYYFSIFIVLQKILGQNTELSSNHNSYSVPLGLD